MNYLITWKIRKNCNHKITLPCAVTIETNMSKQELLKDFKKMHEWTKHIKRIDISDADIHYQY